jgi:hypothetical protein
MDVRSSVDLAATPEAVHEVVIDLGGYPQWLELVRAAAPGGGEPPSWTVELQARLGRLARSKRLRMEMVTNEPLRVVFERRELDGKSHGAWRLSATTTPTDDGCRLAMHLHYSGGLFVPMLEGLLAGEIERAKPRLAALLAQRRGTQAT